LPAACGATRTCTQVGVACVGAWAPAVGRSAPRAHTARPACSLRSGKLADAAAPPHQRAAMRAKPPRLAAHAASCARPTPRRALAHARAHAVTKLPKPIPRDSIRLGLPSKGRMAEDTMQLLKVRCARAAVAPKPPPPPPPVGPLRVLLRVGGLLLCVGCLLAAALCLACCLLGVSARATLPRALPPPQDCALSVKKPNPRQYVATIPQVRRSLSERCVHTPAVCVYACVCARCVHTLLPAL
jgi:hypothetical protein